MEAKRENDENDIDQRNPKSMCVCALDGCDLLLQRSGKDTKPFLCPGEPLLWGWGWPVIGWGRSIGALFQRLPLSQFTLLFHSSGLSRFQGFFFQVQEFQSVMTCVRCRLRSTGGKDQEPSLDVLPSFVPRGVDLRCRVFVSCLGQVEPTLVRSGRRKEEERKGGEERKGRSAIERGLASRGDWAALTAWIRLLKFSCNVWYRSKDRSAFRRTTSAASRISDRLGIMEWSAREG